MNDNEPTLPAVDNNNTTHTPEVLPPPAPQEPVVINNNIPSKKKRLSLAVIVVIVAVLLVAGSAAAYFGVIVPNNKPENVLKRAVANTAKQQKGKFAGKVSFENLDPAAEIKAVNVEFDGQSDSEKGAFQADMKITASGYSLPFEMRGVGDSLFIKIGDMRSIKGLIEMTSPEYAPVVDFLNQELADQWMEVDETLLKQAGAGCLVETSALRFTEEDIRLLNERYDEVPFANIKNQSDDTVNGRPAIKYEIDIDDSKATEFGTGLEELSIVKKLKQCNLGDDKAETSEPTKDEITPITIWVDKGDKVITKLATQTTPQSEERDKTRGVFEMTAVYGEAEINKPSGARPIAEVFNELYNAMQQNSDPNNPILQGLIGN